MASKASNVRAEAFADQVRAAIREGDEIPDGPICAAAVRGIDINDVPPEMRAATDALLDAWAEEHGVDRKGHGNEGE